MGKMYYVQRREVIVEFRGVAGYNISVLLDFVRW